MADERNGHEDSPPEDSPPEDEPREGEAGEDDTWTPPPTLGRYPVGTGRSPSGSEMAAGGGSGDGLRGCLTSFFLTLLVGLAFVAFLFYAMTQMGP